MILRLPKKSLTLCYNEGTETASNLRETMLWQLWRYGDTKEIIGVGFDNVGGTFEENTYSEVSLPTGRYMLKFFNFSTNRLSQSWQLYKGTTAPKSLWHLEPDITSHACHKAIFTGQQDSFIIDLFDNDATYTVDCNATFVNAFLSFSPMPVPSGVNWSENPLKISEQEGVLTFYNSVLGDKKLCYIPNSEFFEGSKIKNPYYKTPLVEPTPETPKTEQEILGKKVSNQNSRRKKVYFGLGLFTLLLIRQKNGN